MNWKVFLFGFLGWAVFAGGTLTGSARAYTLPLPSSFAHEVLSESVPTALSINDFEAEDFSVQWVASPLPGVSLEIEKRSFEWVRVGEVLVLPRARLAVRADNCDAGQVVHEGFSQAMVVSPGTRGGTGRAEVPVALISGTKTPIEIAIKRAGKEYRALAEVKFSPRNRAGGARIYLDPSCSKFGVTAKALGYETALAEKHPDWMMVGCRMVQVEGESYRTSSLEMLVFWDNVGQTVEVGGVSTPASSVSVWALRLRSEPGSVKLGTHGHEVTLSYSIPKNLYRGAFSVGVGPYAFTFRNPSNEVNSWVVMPTLYASYFITESMRVVAFDATTLNSQLVTDFGVYLNSEYIRTLDRRIVINLMLGIHFNGFRNNGRYNFMMGAPQGAEVIFNDFLGRARNLSFGGFVYPSISGKSYYNTWLRWGSPQLFGEFNYIAWEERLDGEQFESRSLGLTVGFPLPFLRFL